MAYPYYHSYIPYTPFIPYQQQHIISTSPPFSTFNEHSSYPHYQPQSQDFYSQLETLKQYLIETHEIKKKSREEMQKQIQNLSLSLKASQLAYKEKPPDLYKPQPRQPNLHYAQRKHTAKFQQEQHEEEKLPDSLKSSLTVTPASSPVIFPTPATLPSPPLKPPLKPPNRDSSQPPLLKPISNISSLSPLPKRSIVRVKSCANPTLKSHLELDNKIPTPPEPPTKTISFLPSVPPPPIYSRHSVLRPPPSKQHDLFLTQSPPLLPLPPKTPDLQTSSEQPSPPPLKHHFHLALRPPSKPPDFVRATTVPPRRVTFGGVEDSFSDNNFCILIFDPGGHDHPLTGVDSL